MATPDVSLRDKVRVLLEDIEAAHKLATHVGLVEAATVLILLHNALLIGPGELSRLVLWLTPFIDNQIRKVKKL